MKIRIQRDVRRIIKGFSFKTSDGRKGPDTILQEVS